MNVLIVALLFFSQIPPIIISAEDVEIRFPTATDNAWKPAVVMSIGYSNEPLSPENPFARLGLLTWEGWMCDSKVGAERKYVIQIQVDAIPSPQDRTLELRVRCRYEDNSGIGPWSDPGSVKIQGKPRHVEVK